MARALSDILSELNNVYQPQRDVYNQQLTALPDQQAAEEKGLESAKTDAFAQITNQANRRGLFYSGVPIAEQAQYTGSTFLPAVANVRNNYATRGFNLKDALSKITQDQQLKAEDIYQTEQNRDANLAAARATGSGTASPSFGLGGSGGDVLGDNTGLQAVKKAGGGYNFIGVDGQPISAALYASQAGIPFRSLLQWMANNGDSGAKNALGFVGNDYRYDPNKIGSAAQANLYNSLVWGTGYADAHYNAPKPTAKPTNTPVASGPGLVKQLQNAFSF